MMAIFTIEVDLDDELRSPSSIVNALLLKALENLVEQVTPPPSLDIDTSVINEARAAIAAAKGEE